MNRNSSKSRILTSVVVVLVCLVLVTGSTFSLFTSKSEVNIAVTSGSVDVKAVIAKDSLNVWSRGETETENSGKFANEGSSAKIDGNKLVLNNIVPGDNAAVTVDVTNESTIAVAYRLVLTIEGELAPALEINISTPAGEFKYGYTEWIAVAPGEDIGDIKVSISFPERADNNDFQGKACDIKFVLEAVQGNGDFIDPITYNETTGVYEVNSEEGMMLMNSIINSVSHGEGTSLKFALTADMDMTGYVWTPIDLLFVDIDGQGHTVSNLNCVGDSWGRSGFAGYAGGVNISNLTLENVTAVGTQVGVLAGAVEGIYITDVTIKGTNSVKYDYAVNPEETWGAAGAIAGVAQSVNAASTVVIADGATIVVDYNGIATEAPAYDEYSMLDAFPGVTNNGTVTVKGYISAPAKDASSLDQNLASGKDVVLTEDLKFSSADTTANSGYGATGVSVKGSVLDGNGHSLGITNWGTWDAAVHTTGGTIKNLTINSGMRGIFMGSATADVYIDNVTIDGTVYTFNSDGGSKEYGVYISNSTLNGWTSFSNVHKEVVFTNCSFGEGQGYAFCRPYNVATFSGCVFEVGYRIDISQISGLVFENCYYGDTLITTANAASLGLFSGNLNNITIK
ncbi:MAG: hypothetical protein IJX58_05415 [Clostridia bacterium]|nr:hypothetical protein [Clostridia bacterium]